MSYSALDVDPFDVVKVRQLIIFGETAHREKITGFPTRWSWRRRRE